MGPLTEEQRIEMEMRIIWIRVRVRWMWTKLSVAKVKVKKRNQGIMVLMSKRRKDNEPLMRALLKFVYVNSPDLVLFAGVLEMTVLMINCQYLIRFSNLIVLLTSQVKPNSCCLNSSSLKLGELSPSLHPRLIDGIMLTKFDTIDDKVGAALSRVYVSGAPVMFSGCGQSYTDLKKLNVKSIAKTLLE